MGTPSPFQATSEYHNLLRRILWDGFDKEDRTGTGTRCCYGLSYRTNIQNYFPLLTTKEIRYNKVFTELCWFFRANDNVEYMQERDCHIWDAWANKYNSVGPVYGVQWFSWLRYHESDCGSEHINQMEQAVHTLKTDPWSRRIIVSAWNAAELEDMKLHPCHILFQLLPEPGPNGWLLSLRMYQRSADMFLGLPFNIASYAALLHVFAYKANMTPKDLYIDIGDAHIYNNHISQVEEQLRRSPSTYESPRLSLVDMTPHTSWDHIDPDNFMIHGYNHYPFIKGDISV